MTRQAILAEELYRLALVLQKYNNFNLSFEGHRTTVVRTLSAMHFLIRCISMSAISDDQAHIIINTLENSLHTRYFDFASSLLDAEATLEHSPENQELLFQMSRIISLCICELCNKGKNYKASVMHCFAILQTLPRAFLPNTNEACLSADNVMDTARKYLKCD